MNLKELHDIEKLEKDLWEAANQLRANSKYQVTIEQMKNSRDILLPKLMSGEITL